MTVPVKGERMLDAERLLFGDPVAAKQNSRLELILRR